jgi:hypothetical protein
VLVVDAVLLPPLLLRTTRDLADLLPSLLMLVNPHALLL